LVIVEAAMWVVSITSSSPSQWPIEWPIFVCGASGRRMAAAVHEDPAAIWSKYSY
jgi:hypothetical protein